jgi:hypothetical protein
MQWLADSSWSEIDSLWNKVKNNGFDAHPPLAGIPVVMKPCKVSKYRKDTRGNVQVCIGGGKNKKHIIVHQLAYVQAKRTRLAVEADAEVSHLCHRHDCCEDTHLVVETRQMNHRRKNCVGHVWSDKHNEWIPVCDHQPPCLTFKKRKTVVANE